MKIALIFIFVILVELGFACRKERHGSCGKEKEYVYCQIQSDFGTLDSSFSFVYSSNDTFDKKNFSIRLEHQLKEGVCYQERTSFIFTTLNATEPCQPNHISKRIDSIQLFDLLALDISIPAEQNIAPFFGIRKYENGKYIGLDSANRDELNANYSVIETQVYQYFKLLKTDISPNWHKFKFKFYIAGGRLLEHTTDSVYLK